ncbi:MAG: 4-alpha-glucanotransferase [Nitrospirae bacterium]|nr:4-alpha-glucanotransferase [Nitrospirota bacterium]
MNVYYYDELIDELSELCGIVLEYWDIFGKKNITSVETKKAVLRAMKINIDSIDDIEREINDRKWRPWNNFLEPVYVHSENDQPIFIPVYISLPEGEESKLTIVWSITDENDVKSKFTLEGDKINISGTQLIDGIRYVKIALSDRGYRDPGYYDINVECRHPENIFPGGSNIIGKKARVIISPDTCYIHPGLQNGRTWGLSINLYAIRSDRNWGVGDFTDLKNIISWIADLKGGFVGINPVHAIPNTKPFGISPYSPLSRLHKNFIYIDIEKLPEIKELTDAGIISSDNLQKELDVCRKADLVDYERIASLKEKILKEAFEVFYRKFYMRNTVRGRDFRNFISGEGMTLEYFSIYMALASKHGGIKNWKEWPEEYHDMEGKNIRVFKRKNKKQILFYQYIQWLIDRQQKEIDEEAKKREMKLGVYHDLAIGSVKSGSDAWSYQNVIAGDTDVGAPPDDFSPGGQNWGFPPMIPEKLKESGYELFIQTIRKNMKYCGALRIDHALGLFRLFWIPHGMSPGDGAYVNYPSEELLRIIALESNRNQTMVIAEDLGTIGENVRESLRSFNMLSYRLFYFERNYPDPSFLPPEKYPEMALCAVTTHDLPAIYGYWSGRDLEVKKQLGQYYDEAIWKTRFQERERDKKLIISALGSHGILHNNNISDADVIPEMTPELCLAIYQYLALTPCKLLLVYLDDILGTIDQQNMPGTVDSYPNWMQKTPLTLDEMMMDKRFIDLSGMLGKII